MNGYFKLTWANVKSAIVYGLLMLLASFALAIVEGVLKAGSIFGLDWTSLIDKSVIGTLPLIIAGLSLVKNLLTNAKGEFLGVTEVIPDKK